MHYRSAEGANMTQPNRISSETRAKGVNVAVPVELQIKLAKNRRDLAAARYDLSVRKGRSWNVPPSERMQG